MRHKINNKWRWLIFLLEGILFPLRMAIAEGGIATDGTMGPAQTLNGPKVDIEQNLGTTVGKNLFHSFEQFNVKDGQTVTFRENTPNALDNVISRVTGGSRSDINGTLSSTPKGHANLYLVNPSGVMFGPNARIDVPGAFHASTADEVRFQDGARFSASQPSGSTLTAAAPASFGFLGTSSATNGLLRVNGAQLAVDTGKKLDMVGRNINVENGAKLTAPSGEVRLEAVGTGSMDIPLDQPSERTHGAITLTRSGIDASGEGGGKVIIRSGDLNMDGSDLNPDGSNLNLDHLAVISAFTNGEKDGAEIDVHLTGDLNMNQGSWIAVTVLEPGSGNPKGIIISAKNIRVEGQAPYLDNTSVIFTGAYSRSARNAGNIVLKADEDIFINGNSWLFSGLAPLDIPFQNNSSQVKAGSILLTARNVEISSGAIINSSNFTSESGAGGGITIQATDAINIHGQGQAYNPSIGQTIILPSQISSPNRGVGQAGPIYLQSSSLNIADHAQISGSVSGAGRGSDITVNVQGDMTMIGGSKIDVSTYGNGAAGNIHVKANNLLIDGQATLNGQTRYDLTDISSTTNLGEKIGDKAGKAGNITVDIDNQLSLVRGGRIISSSFGSGDAGNIMAKAGRLLIDTQGALNSEGKLLSTGIITEAAKAFSGKGGNLEATVRGDMAMKGGGTISASTFGTQNAGDIHVTANNLVIDGKTSSNGQRTYVPTFINSTTNLGEKFGEKAGDSGKIALDITNRLSLIGGGQIGASSFGSGDAGSVMVNAEYLLIDGQDALLLKDNLGDRVQTGIFTAAGKAWSGKGNDITIAIKGDISMKSGGVIGASTRGRDIAGNIHIKARNLTIDGRTINNRQTDTAISTITGRGEIANERTGNAGNIIVDVANRLLLIRGGRIISSAFGTGNAGEMFVTAGQLMIDAQGILTDDFLGGSLQTGLFTSAQRTWSGSGGNLNVDVQGNMTVKGGGEISSTTFGKGDAGSVEVKAGQLLIDRQGATDGSGNPLLTGIFTQSVGDLSGRGGDIAVAVQGDLTMKGGTISSDSFGGKNTGNIKDAGNIKVSSNQLSLEQESWISTGAENGNGGDITIQGGQLIQLINSQFTSSVSGQQIGKGGGNINVTADNLVMETGLIRANTTSPGASGGDITLNLKGLVNSGGRENLILGGDTEVSWQPGVFGINVIQAAAPNGISGHIQSTAPQLDLSGVLSNLGMPQFDTHVISQGYCSLGTGSSLIRQGKGGLPPRSRDSVMY